MVTNYTIKILEVDNTPYKTEETFDLNQMISNAKNGNPALIKNLHNATKIAVCEYHTNNGTHKFFKRYCISKQNQGMLINQPATSSTHLFSKNSMVEVLVLYHNSICNQIHKQKISLNEIKYLYDKIQHNENNEQNSN